VEKQRDIHKTEECKKTCVTEKKQCGAMKRGRLGRLRSTQSSQQYPLYVPLLNNDR
jgi:hypothetical protein